MTKYFFRKTNTMTCQKLRILRMERMEILNHRNLNYLDSCVLIKLMDYYKDRFFSFTSSERLNLFNSSIDLVYTKSEWITPQFSLVHIKKIIWACFYLARTCSVICYIILRGTYLLPRSNLWRQKIKQIIEKTGKQTYPIDHHYNIDDVKLTDNDNCL